VKFKCYATQRQTHEWKCNNKKTQKQRSIAKRGKATQKGNCHRKGMKKKNIAINFNFFWKMFKKIP
jgi:hypothetical protein